MKKYKIVSIAELYGIKYHKEVEEYLKKRGMETEVTMCMNLIDYNTLLITDLLICGRIDAIDHENKKFYEIKPYRSSKVKENDWWWLQLMFYLDILRNNSYFYEPRFILYRHKYGRVSLTIAKPLEIVEGITLLSYDIIKEIILNYSDNIRIAPFSCSKCPLKEVCNPDYKWIKENGMYRLVRWKKQI